MCDNIAIPEHLRPLYLPAPFLSPPVKGMILHTDEEGKESICYPDTVWNQVPDPEKAFLRSEKNRAKRHYRKAMKRYSEAVEIALANNSELPRAPVPPTKSCMEADKYVPRFTSGSSQGYWETVPRGLTEEEEEEFMEKAWSQFETEQVRREKLLNEWMSKNGLDTRTQSFAFKVA